MIQGQQKLKEHLISITEGGNISHGYIFEGPRGIGKLQIAEIFAQTIMCKNSNQEPCEICSSCIKANSGNHPDIHILSFEDNSIKRQDIDDIQEIIYMKPYESDKKIIIINDAQKMTLQAANTFLKTLEEPPKDTIIILLTINSNLLIPTMVSRCQSIKANKESLKNIEEILIKKYGIEAERSRLLSGYSKGILHRAVSINNNELKTLSLREEIIEIVDKLLSKGKSIVFEFEKYFEQNKDDIDEILEIIMIWFRDVLFVKVDGHNQVINNDKIEVLEKHSFKVDSIKCAELYNKLQEAYENVNSNVNYKLTVDNMLFSIQEVRHD
jgi:DNA polymerase-3 subunit delta'